MTPRPDGLRAPYEKISHEFKDSSKHGHKTKGDYLPFNLIKHMMLAGNFKAAKTFSILVQS